MFGVAFTLEGNGLLILHDKLGTNLLKENRSVMKALFCDKVEFNILFNSKEHFGFLFLSPEGCRVLDHSRRVGLRDYEYGKGVKHGCGGCMHFRHTL